MAKRIFIADPKVAVVETLEKKLAEKGYEVISTTYGSEVMRTINVNNVPHLIVLHSNLTEVETLKICKELKSEKRTNTIPILIMREKTADVKPYRELGINRFIDRPCNIDDIIQKIDLLFESIVQRSVVQTKKKLSLSMIAGIVVVILCILIMIFLVFIPLFTSHK